MGPKTQLVALLITTVVTAIVRPADARQIYVSPAGNDANSGLASTSPLKTIAAGSAKAEPGDVVNLAAGVYNEAIVPVRSGTSGSPITYRAMVDGKAVLSHNSVGGLDAAIRLVSVSHIVVEGVLVDGRRMAPEAVVNKFAEMDDSVDITIRGSKFQFANGWAGFDIKRSSRIVIEDNEIDWVGQYQGADGSAKGDSISVTESASRILIRRNRLRHGGHNLLRLDGSLCIVEDNFFDNSFRDVLLGDAGYRSASIMGASNVFQRNFVTGSGIGSLVPDPPLIKVEGRQNIARFNVLARGKAGGLSSSARTGQPLATKLRLYNNTFYRLGEHAWRLEIFDGGEDVSSNVFVNNLIVDTRLTSPDSGSSTDVLIKLKDAGSLPLAGGGVRNNMFSPYGLRKPRTTLAGFDGTMEIEVAQARFPESFQGNLHEVPKFVSLDPRSIESFDLEAGSAGIDEGAFLTTVIGTGMSSKVRLADSLYFTDGFGIAAGDVLQFQGTGERAQIVAIDHATGVITLSRSVSYRDQQGVALVFEGAAPDIGAREWIAGTKVAPNPPTLQVR